MNQAVLVRFDALRSLAFGSIAGVYTAVGTPLTKPMRIVTLQNLTDATVIISADGIVDHKVLPPGGQAIFDFASDKSSTAGMFSMAIGTQWYVKAAVAPTLGTFYISCDYGQGE